MRGHAILPVVDRVLDRLNKSFHRIIDSSRSRHPFNASGCMRFLVGVNAAAVWARAPSRGGPPPLPRAARSFGSREELFAALEGRGATGLGPAFAFLAACGVCAELAIRAAARKGARR